MTEEEYLRNRLDMINRNSVYGLCAANSSEIAGIVRSYMERDIGCDYDRLNSPKPPIYIGPVKCKSLKERLEENTMKATSKQEIKNIRDISFSFLSCPVEMKSELTITATTDDDIFEFVFEGEHIIQSCEKSGMFIGWETDQKIRELEEEVSHWKKEAADCLRLRDEVRREKNKEINKLNQLLHQAEHDKRKYEWKIEELTKENDTADEKPVDNVNHPSHYTGKYECIDVMQDVFGNEATDNFCLCNAFKYIWRARKKNGLEDVKKAVWYLNKYIEEAEKDGVRKGKQI